MKYSFKNDCKKQVALKDGLWKNTEMITDVSYEIVVYEWIVCKYEVKFVVVQINQLSRTEE